MQQIYTENKNRHKKCQQHTTNLNTVTQSLQTLHTVLNTSIFNMVQLELVDWEKIFQQIRVWCTFNPFIVYLFSSFTFFQQKRYTGRGPKRVKFLALVIGWLPLSSPISILHNSILINNSSCKMNATCTSRWTYLFKYLVPNITPNTYPSALKRTIHPH